MDRFFEQLAVRGATIDELISDAFASVRGEKQDTDRAALRLAAWCRSSVSGDWELFAQRLAKDGLSLESVLRRFATVNRNPIAPIPVWLSDAVWILQAMRLSPNETMPGQNVSGRESQPFEHLLFTTVDAAKSILISNLGSASMSKLAAGAVKQLCYTLLSQLAKLCAPAIYQCFQARPTQGVKPERLSVDPVFNGGSASNGYAEFIEHMRDKGFLELFEAKPVLLRLLASITRQWIESTGEFIQRLSADVAEIRLNFFGITNECQVTSVEGELSDPHNFGRSVLLVTFDDGYRAVYKPKDLRLDSFWFNLIAWLNTNEAPIDLRAARVLVRPGYGWAEYIGYAECADSEGLDRFFRRAGAWLGLFHVFAGTDMHQENIIAAGDHPVPVDLETLLQAGEAGNDAETPDLAAFKLATMKIAESILATGLLPFYERTPENRILISGGLNQSDIESAEPYWKDVNTDRMCPAMRKKPSSLLNVPKCEGSPAHLNEFLGTLISGFNGYAEFLSQNRERILALELFNSLRGLPVRRVLRPTQFYYLLLGRLKDHRNMGDGAEWSAHLDFIARLTDWDKPQDPLWPLVQAERNALSQLNIPFFLVQSDGFEVRDWCGVTAQTGDEPGLNRVWKRLQCFGAQEVSWQNDIIRAATSSISVSSTERGAVSSSIYLQQFDKAAANLDPSKLLDNASEIREYLSNFAIRRGASAAWIGLGVLGDSSLSQLAPLGVDLYNGSLGISLFMGAFAHLTGDPLAAELSLAGVAALRFNLKSAGAARFARGLGLGGGSGLGSIVYGLTALGCLLGDEELLSDASLATRLFSAELIRADKSFDVLGGSAGGILGLLKLHRTTGSGDALARAAICGEHLLASRPRMASSNGIWHGLGISSHPLTGMSHGAAGIAYAFAALHGVTGREDFALASQDCIDFENTHRSMVRSNWPDLRREVIDDERPWPCQWCHGASGIGLARLGMWRHGRVDEDTLTVDIMTAVKCALDAWPYPVDTLCCGSLGNVELLNEVGITFNKPELRSEALRRLLAIVADARCRGDYRWGTGEKRFNLGLFRGIAGVGYTLLRQAAPQLPNVLIWE